MPPHIIALDCRRVLPEDLFTACLHSNTKTTGFIAVLAEWIKQVGAFELSEIAQFDAVTTFDGDSLWQSQAIPPIMECGHASATLELNLVSMENLNKPKRLTKLSYEYCAQRRDFLSMATPWRWPRGSPALQSLVRRIRPMVRKDGTWAGGTSFLVIMHTAWDTYNNWGLRSAFNRPQTHSIVPRFAWSGPLAPGTANHPKWGMAVIRTGNAVCVNGMWQTSATDDGPNARDRKAWGEGSLVRVLVNTTLSRCRFAAPSSVEKAFTNVEVLGVLMRKCSTFFTTEEKVGLVRVHEVWCRVARCFDGVQISGVLEAIGVRKERWRDDGLRRPGARGKVQRDCFYPQDARQLLDGQSG